MSESLWALLTVEPQSGVCSLPAARPPNSPHHYQSRLLPGLAVCSSSSIRICQLCLTNFVIGQVVEAPRMEADAHFSMHSTHSQKSGAMAASECPP